MERYSPEPRAGIEARVIARTLGSRKPNRLWLFASALCVPVLLLLVFVLRTLVTKPVEKRVPAVALAVNVPEARPVIREMPRRKGKRVRALKVQPFPTPSPLTAEEQALETLVATRPQVVRELIAGRKEQPIEIHELQIPPLQSDGGS